MDVDMDGKFHIHGKPDYLARQNEFRFFHLINTNKKIFFHFWLLASRKNFAFVRKNSFARVWGLQPSPRPFGSYTYVYC